MAAGQRPAARVLALGDSYTIGEKVAPTDRWPVQLAALLRGKGVNVAEPEIIATTGWTTDELRAGIAAKAPKGPYDLVTLLIGVNNQYRGRAADEYRGEFRGLLAQAIGFAGGDPKKVIVVSIPDWGVTPFAEGRDRAAIGRAIEQFNAIGREEALAAGADFVDITPTSRERRAGWEAEDGLHPSGPQYAVWARLILPSAQRVMGRRP
ncbi:MAG: SGNH/GDSL hydrolase family protein [Gemmatimonadetes bacterium]|nr:SGNH/GDSL hydrolase family protein [Gemmatimonadota bacterium]